MALDSWLVRVRSALSSAKSKASTTRAITQNPPKTIGILCFEVAGIMSKLLHLWSSLSDHHLLLLHRDSISLPGIRKLVSDDDAFLLSLACAEFTDSLRVAADNISLVLAHRCTDQTLRRFHNRFHEFADHGRDDDGWAMGWREMEAKAKKMERFVTVTGDLRRELDELGDMEQCLKRLLVRSSYSTPSKTAMTTTEVRQNILWKKQVVKRLKETSLWGKTFDAVALLAARSAFTVLARIKQVFYFSGNASPSPSALPPPRSSVSSVVHPSSDISPVSNEQIIVPSSKKQQLGFFECSSATLVRPPSTLGSAGLTLRYANIVLVIEKMIRSPRSIGPDARDDLYSMLPASLSSTLRGRLWQVAGCPATDARLANEWRTALEMIIDWLSPLAHNTIRWQSELSFERRGSAAASTPTRSGVLVLQTLHFAQTGKAEAAVAELLVGLNYVWRFEMGMAMKARSKAASPALLLTPADQRSNPNNLWAA